MVAPVDVPDEWKQLGIGIVGVGRIVQSAHLPAYRKHGLRVMGATTFPLPRSIKRCWQACRAATARWTNYWTTQRLRSRRSYSPGRPPRRGARGPSGRQACACAETSCYFDGGGPGARHANRTGCKLAVNVNGRWAPPWMGVTRLLAAGLLGRPFAVTHLYDVSFAWIRGTHFDEMEHFGLYDYSVHWVDIGLRWLRPALPLTVTAVDYRLESQPEDSHSPWGLDIYVAMSDCSTIAIRGIGGSPTQSGSHPFIVHGTAGMGRGSVLGLTNWSWTGRATHGVPIGGQLVPRRVRRLYGRAAAGFVEGGQPDNSARDGLSTLAVVLAAVVSAENEGTPVRLAADIEPEDSPRTAAIARVLAFSARLLPTERLLTMKLGIFSNVIKGGSPTRSRKRPAHMGWTLSSSSRPTSS